MSALLPIKQLTFRFDMRTCDACEEETFSVGRIQDVAQQTAQDNAWSYILIEIVNKLGFPWFNRDVKIMH
jgi:hypothetical protein